MERLGHEVHNRLLLAMPPAALQRLMPALQHVSLRSGQSIDRVNGPIEHLYFVNLGFVSMVKTMLDGRVVEIGGVGVEGVTSPSSMFGMDDAVFEAMVQIPGDAFRIRREALRREVEQDRAVRDLMEGYMHYQMAGIGQTAACNRLHSVEERCCRWLLLAQDNARSDRFPLTHEFLAMMLGAQRAGVSIAARALKLVGLIDYARGVVTILDREGLEEAACECYRTTQDELELLFGRSDAATGTDGP